MRTGGRAHCPSEGPVREHRERERAPSGDCLGARGARREAGPAGARIVSTKGTPIADIMTARVAWATRGVC